VADVRVAEPGRRAGFPDESRSGCFALHRLIGQELEGYVAVKLLVVRAEDNAHSARAELRQDLIVGDRLPDQGFHGAPEREADERVGKLGGYYEGSGAPLFFVE